MKNIMIGICSFVLLGIVVLIIFTLHGRSVRKQELNYALTSSMQNVMERLQTDTVFAPKSDEELIAMFQQEFLMQIESNSDVTIHILAADCEKGLLSVEAIFTYKHPIGTQGNLSARRTAIIEVVE